MSFFTVSASSPLGLLLTFLGSCDWLLVSSALVCIYLGHLVVQHFYVSVVEEEDMLRLAQQRQQGKKATAAAATAEPAPAEAAEFSVLPHRVPERAVCRGPQVEMKATGSKACGDELKVVLVLRRDLKPSELVAASWGATAALELVQHVRARAAEPSISWLCAWNRGGVAKIATRVDGNDAMLEVIRAAIAKGLPMVGIAENVGGNSSASGAAAAAASKAGGSAKKGGGAAPAAPAKQKLGGGEVLIEGELLQTAPGVEPVCIAIGPAPVDDFDDVTGELKLYH